jgi:uncharacterized YccA/Bax inhibitor family protein
MSVFRTSNPLLTADAFRGDGGGGRFGNFNLGSSTSAAARPTTMTLQGTVNATLILLGLCVASAIFCFSFLQKNQGALIGAASIGGIVSLVGLLAIYFKPGLSPYAAPLIAVAKGCTAGAASVFWTAYAQRSESQIVGQLGAGLVIQAALLTIAIAGGLLVAYKSRLIKVTQNFRLGVVAATLGLFFFSIIALVLSMFGVQIPYIWDNGPIGLIFTGAIVVLAALNLVLDFDFIEQGAENGLPRHMEWYAAIGLLVTLVWLYVSLLRLLAQLQRRD